MTKSTQPAQSEREAHLRSLARTPKTALAERVEDIARAQGRRWVLGGPHMWTKDQLVHALMRVYDGEAF